MSEPLSESKIHELRFIELVYSFQQLAMIALGKLANPATHQVERQLPQAHSLIETLRMLKAKSQGNLSETEQRLIDQVILTLELNYADEVQKDRAEPKAGATPPSAPPSEAR